MPKLIFTGEQFAGRVYELAVEKTTVGRGDHNTLVLRDNSVSQTHCEIIVNGPEVIIHDLNSANGTFVAGTRLNSQSQVLSGQLVRFGWIGPTRLGPLRDDEARRRLQDECPTDVQQIEGRVGAPGHFLWEVVAEDCEAQNGCGPCRCDDRPHKK